MCCVHPTCQFGQLVMKTIQLLFLEHCHFQCPLVFPFWFWQCVAVSYILLLLWEKQHFQTVSKMVAIDQNWSWILKLCKCLLLFCRNFCCIFLLCHIFSDNDGAYFCLATWQMQRVNWMDVYWLFCSVQNGLPHVTFKFFFVAISQFLQIPKKVWALKNFSINLLSECSQCKSWSSNFKFPMKMCLFILSIKPIRNWLYSTHSSAN